MFTYIHICIYLFIYIHIYIQFIYNFYLYIYLYTVYFQIKTVDIQSIDAYVVFAFIFLSEQVFLGNCSEFDGYCCGRR